MNPPADPNLLLGRRAFLARSATGLGAMALASMLPSNLLGRTARPVAAKAGVGALKGLHLPAKANLFLSRQERPSAGPVEA